MKKKIYGIHGNDDVVFFSQDAAESYLLQNYAEYITCKDQFTEYCENMIWEDYVVECCYCNEMVEGSDYQLKGSNCGEFYYHDYCSM